VKDSVPWMLISDEFSCATKVMTCGAVRFIEYFGAMPGLLVISAPPVSRAGER
jgi:hypothetical protein